MWAALDYEAEKSAGVVAFCEAGGAVVVGMRMAGLETRGAVGSPPASQSGHPDHAWAASLNASLELSDHPLFKGGGQHRGKGSGCRLRRRQC